MKEEARKYGWGKRLLAFALAMLMMVGYLPTAADAASEPGTVDTVADPGTLPRVEQIYGENTMNAGKVSVGKSVSDGTVTLPTGEVVTYTEKVQCLATAYHCEGYVGTTATGTRAARAASSIAGPITCRGEWGRRT